MCPPASALAVIVLILRQDIDGNVLNQLLNRQGWLGKCLAKRIDDQPKLGVDVDIHLCMPLFALHDGMGLSLTQRKERFSAFCAEARIWSHGMQIAKQLELQPITALRKLERGKKFRSGEGEWGSEETWGLLIWVAFTCLFTLCHNGKCQVSLTRV